jgi:endo-1,3-1,4-beta-glycanase ExoK
LKKALVERKFGERYWEFWGKNMKVIKYLTCLFAMSFILISVVQAGANTYPSHGALNWKGQTWYLSSGTSNPCNNTWNNTGAWVDDQNRLHLTIVKDKGVWKSTMLNSKNTYLYGTFTWTVASPIYTFDKNSVMGLFTYLDDYHELDIETTRWGETRGNQLWYSVQPSRTTGICKGYLIPSSVNGVNTKYTLDWKPNYVRFTAMQPNGKVIADYMYTNVSGIPKQHETLLMNLWLMTPPSDGKNIELIISDLQITKYSAPKVAKRH